MTQSTTIDCNVIYLWQNILGIFRDTLIDRPETRTGQFSAWPVSQISDYVPVKFTCMCRTIVHAVHTTTQTIISQPTVLVTATHTRGMSLALISRATDWKFRTKKRESNLQGDWSNSCCCQITVNFTALQTDVSWQHITIHRLAEGQTARADRVSPNNFSSRFL